MDEERINWVNGIWEDGEWVSWDHIEEFVDDEGGWDSDSEQKNPSTLELW